MTQTYNPGNIIKDSVGNYHFDLDTTTIQGAINYDWVSTGTGQSSVAGALVVVPLPA